MPSPLRQQPAGDARRSRRGGPAWRRAASAAASIACWMCLLPLAGCGQFFAKSTGGSGTGTGGGGSSTTGDYLYVANANTSLDTVAGFALSSSTLSSTASSPYALGELPTTMAITPSNSFLYVGSEVGEIYVYAVSSTGQLTIANSGGPVAAVAPTSMVVDPTGKWLLALQDAGTAPLLSVFAIDATAGTLTTQTSVSLDTGSSGSLLLIPNSTLVYVTLGIGGVDALTFNSTTGALAKLSVLISPRGNASSDQHLATDGTYLFVTETGTSGVRSFTINANGTVSELAGSPTATALGPGAVLVDSTGSYLYVANSTAGTISAFTIAANGALTPIAGSPFTTGSSPSSLTEDNSGAYLAVTCTGGTPDLQIFSISTTTPGALVSATSASTGSTNPAGAYAVVATN